MQTLLRFIDTIQYMRFCRKSKSKKGLPNRQTLSVTCQTYLSRPNFLLNLATRPPVSTSFCLPVKKGVTLRADFHLDILLGRTCLNHITAGASNRSLLIIGMDSFLHCSRSPLS